MQKDDEIDLFELFVELYRGKWLIILAILVAMACGGSYAKVKEKSHVTTYKSTIAYSPKNLPPFIDAGKAADDLDALFHSQASFEIWKASNAQSPLEYQDFSRILVVNGYQISRPSAPRLFLGTLLKPSVSEFLNGELSVRSNDLAVLDSYYSYLQSLNETLTRDYLVQALEEMNEIENRFRDYWSWEDKLKIQLLNVMAHTTEIRKIQRFIASIESGAKVFSIRHPTPPIVTSAAPKTNLILALSFVLGGFIGVASVVLRNAIHRRSETSKSG